MTITVPILRFIPQYSWKQCEGFMTADDREHYDSRAIKKKRQTTLTCFPRSHDHAHAPRAVSGATRHLDAELVLGVWTQVLDPGTGWRHVDESIPAAHRTLTVADRVNPTVREAGVRRGVGPCNVHRRGRGRHSVDADRRHQRNHGLRSYKQQQQQHSCRMNENCAEISRSSDDRLAGKSTNSRK